MPEDNRPDTTAANILDRTMSDLGKSPLVRPLDKAFRKLSEAGQLDRSGAVLASSEATLREGYCYFIGLNPGGDDDEVSLVSAFPTIRESLALARLGCNGFDQDWSRDGASYPAGGSPMQQRFKFICSQLGLTYSQVFATNFVFARSRDVASLEGFARDVDVCAPVHQIFLGTVKPKFFWLMGNTDTVGLKPDFEWTQSGHGNWSIGRGEISLWGETLPAFHTPHLSSWSPEHNMKALMWTLEKVSMLVPKTADANI